VHEPMTLELVVTVLRDLQAAFPSKMDDKALVRRAEVYRDNLNGVSGQALRWAAKQAIQEDNFFPKISRLRDLATRWTIANPPTATFSAGTKDKQCARCRVPFEVEKRYRPARKDSGWGPLIVSADGKWLILEQYTRDTCRCSAKCEYWPEINAPMKEPAMALLSEKGAPTVPMHVYQEAIANRPRAKHIPAPLIAKPEAA
jgi:hypothetical protein